MKSVLRFLILGATFLSNVVFAQNLELETVRSGHSPGFFMIKVFPNKETPQIEVQNIFVKNFPTEQEDLYSPLYEVIHSLNGTIVNDRKIVLEPGERLIFLGEPYKNYLSFAPENTDEIIKEFEEFTDTFIGPVFLENITVNFSKNISDVYPKKVDFLSSNGATFIGKFNKPALTQIKINGFTGSKSITAMGNIDLRDSALAKVDKETQELLTAELPQWWDELWNKETFGNTPPPKEFMNNLLSMFPLILVFAGVLLILFSVKASLKNEDDMDLPTDELPMHNFDAMNEDSSFNEDLPFDVERRDDI